MQSDRIRQMIKDLRFAGYTQKEIRNLTGIPERTQSRIYNVKDHSVRKLTKRRSERVTGIQDRYKISPKKIEKPKFIDLILKQSKSKYFKSEVERVHKRQTKYKEFTEHIFTPKEITDMSYSDFKKIVGNKTYWGFISGHQQTSDSSGKIPFNYSTKSFKNPTEKQFKEFKKEINKLKKSKVANYRYINKKVLDISIITSRSI